MTARRMNWPKAARDREWGRKRDAERKRPVPKEDWVNMVAAQMTAKMRHGSRGKPITIREKQALSCGSRKAKVTLPPLSFLKGDES